MVLQITPSKRTLGEIVKTGPISYFVPFFQREYSWPIEEVEQFWEDIKGSYDNGDEYYLGPITLERRGDAFSVLDGQQRLTTLMTILCIIRDVYFEVLEETGEGAFLHREIIQDDNEDELSFRLHLNYLDLVFFRDCILRWNEDDKKITFEEYEDRYPHKIRESNELLREVYSKYRERIEDIINNEPNRSAKLRDLKNYLISKLIFVVMEVGGSSDAFKIFEGMNERGIRLRQADLIKNYLCAKAVDKGYIPKSPTEKPELIEKWEEVLENVGLSEITNFIRHYWLSKHGDVEEKKLFDAVKTSLDNGYDPLELTEDLVEYSGYYAELTGKQHPENDVYCEVLAGIRGLKATRCYPLLLSARSILGINNRLLAELAKYIEILTMRYSTVCGYDAKPLETIYHTNARDLIKEGPAKLEDIKSALIDKMPGDDEFEIRWQQMRRWGKSQQVDYILREIEKYSESELGTGETVNVDSLWVEHIMPRAITNNWVKHLNEGDCELNLYNHYKEMLGNLTLLGDKLNNKAKQKLYIRKSKDYYKKSIVQMTKELGEKYEDWDFEAITARHNELLKLALIIWAKP